MMKRLSALALGALVTLGGCATTGTGIASDAPGDTAPTPPPLSATPPVWPKITVSYPDSNLLDVSAKVGEQYDIGVALMQGIGLRALHATEHREVRFTSLIEDVAQETGCLVETTPYYLFVYPPGYEALLRINLYDQLPNVWRDRALSVAFDGNRKLHAVLAFLSDALDTTIVADNLVADASIGFVRLPYAPAPAVLNAVLKSARVVPEAFAVAAGDDYIFIHRRGGAGLSTAYAGDASEDAAALLGRTVSIALPESSTSSTRFRPAEGAVPLGRVLESLSRQVGTPITAGATLHTLPVNQTIINDQPLQRALDLLVRQWPVNSIGYTVVNGTIHIDRIR